MRKPRDFDSEMKALTDKAKRLRDRKVRSLGELVVATGADVLDLDVLAGALVATSDADAAAKEEWRRRGVRFFQGTKAGGAGGPARGAGGAAAGGGGATPA